MSNIGFDDDLVDATVVTIASMLTFQFSGVECNKRACNNSASTAWPCGRQAIRFLLHYTAPMNETSLLWALHIVAQVAVVIRILLRRHREPASRVAWVEVVTALPVVGIIAYLLLGETNIGRRNFKALNEAIARVANDAPALEVGSSDAADPPIPAHYAYLRVAAIFTGS